MKIHTLWHQENLRTLLKIWISALHPTPDLLNHNIWWDFFSRVF